jgi:hypothetical protein
MGLFSRSSSNSSSSSSSQHPDDVKRPYIDPDPNVPTLWFSKNDAPDDAAIDRLVEQARKQS